jgi:thioesterase domain-containing protein
MVGLIDRRCRMQISIALVFRNPTIAELACCLDSSVTEKSVSLAYESRFLRVLRQGKGTATLVCLGVPNGQLMLQLTQDLTILQLNTEPHLQWGIEQFADAFALEVERAAASGPIIIVGYSYGGLNAFALAGRLRRRVGQSVELVMIEPSVPSWKHKLAHTPAESRTERIGRHLGNLRAGGAKGWSTYMMEKVSWVVWRHQERWERWLILWKVKLNLPLKPGQKQFFNGLMYVRNIRNYSMENVPGDAHLLGSAEYIQKHKDFWRGAVGGECRTRLLTSNSHHLDILDPTKSNEWIGFLAELVRSAKQ